MVSIIGAVGALVPVQMKTFDASEDEAAWTWVRGD
jgi:hypothetical protein